MKKVITAIILALLTSPVFADFEFTESFTNTVEKRLNTSFASNLSTDGKLVFSVTKKFIIILKPMHSSSRFSSEVTKISFKFDDDQPRMCDYQYGESLTIIGDPSCRKWLVDNLEDKEDAVRVQYFNEDGELVESTVSLKGSLVAMSDLFWSGKR